MLGHEDEGKRLALVEKLASSAGLYYAAEGVRTMAEVVGHLMELATSGKPHLAGAVGTLADLADGARYQAMGLVAISAQLQGELDGSAEDAMAHEDATPVFHHAAELHLVAVEGFRELAGLVQGSAMTAGSLHHLAGVALYQAAQLHQLAHHQLHQLAEWSDGARLEHCSAPDFALAAGHTLGNLERTTSWAAQLFTILARTPGEGIEAPCSQT